MATACFMQRIIEMTDAAADQDHLDMIVFNRPQIPDRTAYIMDNTKPSPIVPIAKTAKALEGLGCAFLATPCVTSHYLIDEIQAKVNIPVINMVKETALQLKKNGIKKAGIMATSGTVSAGLFQRALEDLGIDYCVPDEQNQALVMSLIYDDVKAGKPANLDNFKAVQRSLLNSGSDGIILGCTELSVIKGNEKIGAGFIDVLDALSLACITKCGLSVKKEYENLITE